MASLERGSDETGVSVRSVLALLVGALAISALVGVSKTATAAGRACIADAAGNGGYTYAGHQATRKGHGVRATISAVREPGVVAGHVAGWIGLGGPGLGPNGEDMWIQVGLASVNGLGTFLYAEIARPGRDPQFILLEENVPLGESRRLAVLEMSRGRMGMTAVLDAGGNVRGIFTDGDLRRALEKALNFENTAIAEVMTPGPRTIRPEALAVEAVQVMERHKVNQLLVVDERGQLVGALNMHDLFRAKVL